MKKEFAVKKVLITGFFGVNNLGDDIMLDEFCRALLSTSNISITVLNLYGNKNNYKLPKDIKVLDISRFKHGKTIIISEYLSRKYDALFWVGGTCFTENAGNGCYPYMKSFYKRGKQFGYIGVGIGDVTSESKKGMYRWLFDNASLITFRDKESFKTAEEWTSNRHIYLCDDLVYLLEKNTPKKENNTSGYLLISWRSFTGYYEKDIEDKAISELCKYVILNKEQYSHVYVAVLGNDVDIKRNIEIYSELSKYMEVIFCDSLSTDKKIDLIISAKTVITGRLHGVFISEINQVNTIAIGYDNKLERFMESINASEDLVYPPDMTVESISKAEENITHLSNKTIYHKKKNALRNVELFNNFTKGIL